MQIQSLNGSWSLYKAQENDPIPATVPGCVQVDLLNAGQLQDPYYRDNEVRQFWIGETDWRYTRRFDVSADLLNHERVLLRCHGLDTLATVFINGQQIARTENMYRTWEFDVKALLKPGQNEIEVKFDAVMPWLAKQEAEKGAMYGWGLDAMRNSTGGWIRKEPCNFGWDWGPMLVTSGIWKDIELVAFDTARLSDVYIVQEHADGSVNLTVKLALERLSDAPVAASVKVKFGGAVVAEVGNITFDGNHNAEAALVINEPNLWWPAGMGEQPLYNVTVTLHDSGENTLGTSEKRIGLRTLKLDRHEDEWGESFQFACNGIPYFAKGANWIPADVFAPRLTEADYDRLLNDTVSANMNMLRVWGGGLYEDDRFYDLCDEYGVTIWQDFIFACGVYPAYDGDFMANVKQEAADNVKRIRHHASLALWCGNNELEQGLVGDKWTDTTMSWEDYDKLFNDLLPAVVSEYDPQTSYWPASPHSPVGDRVYWMNPDVGDTHLWFVWHGKEPFEWYRSRPDRFCSEFGFQSFPEPETVYTFTTPEDRNITSYIMEHHQRSGIGNSTIIHYMLDWFRLPTSFEGTLWVSQILQGMAMKYAIEHWRRNMPRTMGTLYWQLNDCWPAPSWASIDSLGKWKALHFMAKRFYAPLLVSGLEDTEAGTVEVHVTSDKQEAIKGTVIWTITDLEGSTLDSGEQGVNIPARTSNKITTIDLSGVREKYAYRELLVWLELEQDGEVVSDNLVLLARPKHLDLPSPQIDVSISGDTITLKTDKPALYVWLSVPGESETVRFSDNFFYMRPGQTYTVTATGIDSAALKDKLLVQNLLHTYQ